MYITSIERTRVSCQAAKAAYSLSERDAVRFWAKVDRRGEGDCWLWQASTIGRPTALYGQFVVTVAPGKQVHLYAHRVAWELTHGPIGDGVVLHSCDTPKCCNPNHLSLGTQADNMKDAAKKGRFSVPRPNHPKRKLTDGQVDEIRMLSAGGMRQNVLAQKFAVSTACISLIVRGLSRNYTAPQLQQDKRRTA